MSSTWRTAHLDDPSTLDRLASEIRAWDPAFDLARPPADALVFEPDGTLYALAVRTSMRVVHNHRERLVNPGDLIIVPRGLALDAGSVVDLVGVCFDGRPPEHFRERFIQVWGYDFFPAAGEGPESDVIADSDLRFPISYSVHRLAETPLDVEPGRPGGLQMLIGLEGRVELVSSARDTPCSLQPGEVALTDADIPLSLRGTGRLACLCLEPEWVLLARRQADRDSASKIRPEYSPPPIPPAGSCPT